MEEQTGTKEQKKSVFKIFLIILGMLAFGALGFYFGIQDTFHVSNKIVKEKKEEPNIEIKTVDEEKEEKQEKQDNIEIDNNKIRDYIPTIFGILGMELIDLSNLNVNETISLNELTEEEQFNIIFHQTKLFGLMVENSDDGKSTYQVSKEALQTLATKLGLTINTFPETYKYNILTDFKLVGDNYTAEVQNVGIITVPPITYEVVSTLEENNIVTAKVNKLFYHGEYEDLLNQVNEKYPNIEIDENICSEEYCLGEQFELAFEKDDDNYLLQSITRLK